MRRGLTVRAVEAMQPAPDRREIADGYLPGLYFVVQPSGARSWAVRYRFQGITRKHTLGGYPAIDLKAARELGAKALRAVAEGRDPGFERTQRRASKPDSVDSVAAEFIERHCQRVNRPKTAYETERLLKRHVLPRWAGRGIDSITRRDVIDLLDRIVDSGAPIEANRALAAVRKMFSWAVSRDIVAISPVQGVKPPSAETSRDRVLSDDELRHIWKAASKLGFPFGSILQLLICTGQRRDEVGHMRWSELDFKKQLWTLPRDRMKANQLHEVPLNALAIEILKATPRFAESDLVFTTNGAAPVSGYSKIKRRIDALLPSGMPHWVLHDVRRSVASGLARIGVGLPVIEKILGHSSGSFRGVVGIYQRFDFADAKRQALEAWGQHVDALVSGKPAKAVRLRGQK